MQTYNVFLGAMCFVFLASAAALLILSLIHVARRRGRKAAVYLALTLLATGVAAGFYFFRNLL